MLCHASVPLLITLLFSSPPLLPSALPSASHSPMPLLVWGLHSYILIFQASFRGHLFQKVCPDPPGRTVNSLLCATGSLWTHFHHSSVALADIYLYPCLYSPYLTLPTGSLRLYLCHFGILATIIMPTAKGDKRPIYMGLER